MEIRKTVRITDKEQNMLDFLRKKYKCTESTIFLIALDEYFKGHKE